MFINLRALSISSANYILAMPLRNKLNHIERADEPITALKISHLGQLSKFFALLST